MSAAPRHVLLVNHVARMAGAERGLLDIVQSLGGERYRFTVALPTAGDAHADARLADALRTAGARVVRAPLRRLTKTRHPLLLLNEACRWLATVARLRTIIRREHVDIVHANSNTAQLYAGPAARLCRVPCVWHSRDLVNLGPLAVPMLRLSARCIAISKAVARHLGPAAARVPGRLVTLYNGTDTAFFRPTPEARPAARTALGLPPDAPVVTTVGQLVPWKGHTLFLEAAAIIASECKDARFLVVGDDLFGDHPAYCRELRENARAAALGDRVMFTGNRDDIRPILAATDVLIHPAAREPFGRAVAEAMALEVPVVAVEADGPAELIRAGIDGLLVPPDDGAALAGAALSLLRDPPAARRLGRIGRERILTAFSLEAFAAGLAALYEEVSSCA